jgi:hypothetical protein
MHARSLRSLLSADEGVSVSPHLVFCQWAIAAKPFATEEDAETFMMEELGLRRSPLE